MPDVNNAQPAAASAALDLARERALFDAFAALAARTAVWSQDFKDQLPAKNGKEIARPR